MNRNLKGIVTASIHATASEVWNALTNPEIIRQYFFGTEAISDWKEGSPLVFRGEWQGQLYEDKGVIKISEPFKLLQYSYWSSMSGLDDKPENYQTITYELFEEGGDTTLTIIQENIPDEERMVHSEQNWRKVLKDMKDLLEQNTTPYSSLMS